MIMMWQTAQRGAVRDAQDARHQRRPVERPRQRMPPEFLLKNDLRWYAENIATDFYAEYHRYRGGPDPELVFLQKRRNCTSKDPTSKEAFKRHPSLSDPAWLQTNPRPPRGIRAHCSPYRPVFYDLGDESGIADLAAFWDFDFSDHSLAGMRAWLRERYGTLAAPEPAVGDRASQPGSGDA